MNKVCSIKGCGSSYRVSKRGYCSKHSRQILKFGYIKNETIHTANDVILKEGYAEVVLKNIACLEVARAIIDIEDVDRVKQHKWRLSADGSVTTDIKNTRKIMRLGRLLMNPEEGLVIDHINRNPLDNRKSNLRIVTQQINVQNSSIRKANKSGVVGVYWYESLNKWRVRIQKNYKTIHLGVFDSFDEAVRVRKSAELEYFGETILR